MKDVLGEIASKHASKRPIFDAGLLLLLFIGQVDHRFISRCKRTSTYSVTDWKILIALVEHFGAPRATPHILAETSNLAGAIKGLYRQQFFTELTAWLIDGTAEVRIDSRSMGSLDPGVVTRFGVTDSITIIAASDHLVITDDELLAGELQNRSLDVVDFRQLRRTLFQHN